jgi:hypothetical protein
MGIEEQERPLFPEFEEFVPVVGEITSLIFYAKGVVLCQISPMS